MTSSSFSQTAVGLCGEERNMPIPRHEGIIKNKLERRMCVCVWGGGGGGCVWVLSRLGVGEWIRWWWCLWWTMMTVMMTMMMTMINDVDQVDRHTATLCTLLLLLVSVILTFLRLLTFCSFVSNVFYVYIFVIVIAVVITVIVIIVLVINIATNVVAINDSLSPSVLWSPSALSSWSSQSLSLSPTSSWRHHHRYLHVWLVASASWKK